MSLSPTLPTETSSFHIPFRQHQLSPGLGNERQKPFKKSSLPRGCPGLGESPSHHPPGLFLVRVTEEIHIQPQKTGWNVVCTPNTTAPSTSSMVMLWIALHSLSQCHMGKLSDFSFAERGKKQQQGLSQLTWPSWAAASLNRIVHHVSLCYRKILQALDLGFKSYF